MLSKISVGNDHSLVIATHGVITEELADIKGISRFQGKNPYLIGLIENDLVDDALLLFDDLLADQRTDQVLLLTGRFQLPNYSAWEQGELTSFICSWDLFDDHLVQFLELDPQKWAYHLMAKIYDLKIKPQRLEVIQLPLETSINLPGNDQHVQVILPHKGRVNDLEACLHSIEANSYENCTVMVGLDDFEASPSRYQELISNYRHWSFYQSEPAEMGPFVLREHLINELDDGLIIYQDSDDLSTTDRFAKLTRAMEESDDMIGSHEVVFNEITETLTVRRYPLDVNLALKSKPAFPLLHSTAITTLEGFRKVGGYSTDRKFANDTQFLYRCYFHLRIRNLDEFLYIRKIHKKSLTNVSDHPLDGAVRQELGDTWRNDFIDVMNDRKALDDTSLKTIKKANTYIVPLNKKVQEIKSPA